MEAGIRAPRNFNELVTRYIRTDSFPVAFPFAKLSFDNTRRYATMKGILTGSGIDLCVFALLYYFLSAVVESSAPRRFGLGPTAAR
jgi:hypothetical protein